MSHKCLAHSDYVDITKRELVDELTSGDESEDEKEDRSRNDDAKEYRLVYNLHQCFFETIQKIRKITMAFNAKFC